MFEIYQIHKIVRKKKQVLILSHPSSQAEGFWSSLLPFGRAESGATENPWLAKMFNTVANMSFFFLMKCLSYKTKGIILSLYRLHVHCTLSPLFKVCAISQ